MISELKRAFEIGFLFLAVPDHRPRGRLRLMSMGMMMLPPVVSLPFKLIFFVWRRLVAGGGKPGGYGGPPMSRRPPTADGSCHAVMDISPECRESLGTARGIAKGLPAELLASVFHLRCAIDEADQNGLTKFRIAIWRSSTLRMMWATLT